MKKKSYKPLSRYEIELKELQQTKLYRTLQIIEPKKQDFSSNDYLSLSSHAGIRRKLIAELKKGIPLSSTGSRLISGHTQWHEETEKIFQSFINHRKSVLFFNSGYMANMGVISTLSHKASIFSDQFNHASLIDGCRISSAKCFIYKHKNLNQLEDLLKKSPSKNKIIITESLFSMDGDFAPLTELSELALKYGSLLIVDEAHATGIYGPKGGGLYTSLKGEKEHIISIHPCGKALSAHGAFVALSDVLKKYLINKCRPFIYTTASSPLLLFHIKCVLNTLKNEPNRRKSLKKKALFFRNLLKDFTSVETSDSPIVPVLFKGPQAALGMAHKLQKEGYDIKAIRYPTVPKGKERIRISIHYNHNLKELKALTQLLRDKY